VCGADQLCDEIILELHVRYLSNSVIKKKIKYWLFGSNATFNNISAISWRPVSVVEEAGVPGENYRPWASNW
jgi:hypothetical protein